MYMTTAKTNVDIASIIAWPTHCCGAGGALKIAVLSRPETCVTKTNKKPLLKKGSVHTT